MLPKRQRPNHTVSPANEPLNRPSPLSGEELSRVNDLLSSELQRLAIEGQSFSAVIAALMASALVSAGGFLALQARDTASHPVPSWIWALAGGIPLMIVSYAAIQFTRATMRSYHSRHIERALYHLNRADLDALRHEDVPPSPATECIQAAVDSTRHGPVEVRIITVGLQVVITGAVVVGAVVAIQHIKDNHLQVLASLGYAVIALATLSLTMRGSFASQTVWKSVWRRAAYQLGIPYNPSQLAPAPRRLITYLAMPRPADFLVKAIGLHLTATIIGWWCVRAHYPFLAALRIGAVLVLCFEYLVYQGRYMLNDKLGQSADHHHPYRELRRRLPLLSSPERLFWYWTTVTLRFSLGFVLPFWLLPSRHDAIVLDIGSAGICLLATVYEAVRHASHVCLPFSVIRDRISFRAVIGPVLLVGASYGARAAMGLWFGSRGMLSGWPLVIAALTFYCYGSAIVQMTWILEGLCYINRRDATPVTRPTRKRDIVSGASEALPALGDRLLDPSRHDGKCDQNGNGRLSAEQQFTAFGRSLESKPHILWLLFSADLLTSPAMCRHFSPSEEASAGDMAGLRHAPAFRLWNGLFLLATAGTAVLGAGLVHGTPFQVGRLSIGACVSGVAAGVFAIALPKVGRSAIAAASGLACVLLARFQDHFAPIAVVPTAMILVVYCSMREMSSRQIVTLDRDILAVLRSLPPLVERLWIDLIR